MHHLVRIASLSFLIVDIKPKSCLIHVGHAMFFSDFSDERRVVEAFGFFPRLTIFAGSFLGIAACELNTCGITENIFLGFLGSHKARFRRGFADSNNEFNFKAK